MNIGMKMWEIIRSICYVIVQLLFKMCRRELTEEAFEDFMQFVKFGIVGVSNTFISYFLYAGSLIGLNKVGGDGKFHYLLAQVIAFLLSVLWSFYWNNKFVFIVEEGKERNILKSLIKTYISYSFTGLFLSSVLLFLWVDICGISAFIAPIINLFVSVPVNFIINKVWAFKTS